MKIAIVYVIVFTVLYHNWTNMGLDNERIDLSKIQHSQGQLIKFGVEE